MPKNKENGQGILEEAQEAFINSSINEVGGFLANVAVSIIPISGASFIKSPLVAAFRTAGCSMRNKTKRKAESDSAEEIEFGEKEGPDGFQYVYDNDEITNKRPRVVDNFVGREEEEQELDELFGIPKPATNFVEREELEELSKNFKKNCFIQVLTSRVSIVGLGGIGKTQLAAKFVERNKEKYKNIFWIDAENYCIQDSFEKLAEKVGVKEGEEKNVNGVYEKINSLDNQKTLIVFDNVDDYDSVKGFLPHSDYGAIHVLITSRYNKWKNTGVHTVQLGVFTLEESKEFIKKELEIDDDEEAKKLHNKLQGLPLALQQAVAYIKQQRILASNFGIKDYLKEYDKEAEELLSYDLHENNNDPYMKTVMTTWQVTLNKIKEDKEAGEEAIKILNVMAYLVPDNIPNAIFSELVRDQKLIAAINLLKNYSMINQGSKDDLSNIHRLVQEVIRIKLETEEVEKETLEDAFSILDKKYNTRSGQQYDISNKDYKTMSAVLACMHASNYDSLHKRIEQLFRSLINEEEKRARIIKEGEGIIKDGELFLRHAVRGNNVMLVGFILNDVQNIWNTNYTQDVLIGFVDNDDAQKSKIIEFLISRIANIDRIDVIDNSNCMEVVKALAKLGKFNEERKFQYLIEAIRNANLDVVKFILEDEPSLVKKKLEENCFAYNDDNEYAYFVKKGSDILKLAREIGNLLQWHGNIKKIIALIEEVEGKIRDLDRKKMDVHHEKQPPTLVSELQNKVAGYSSDTSDDEEELLDLGYVMVDSDPESTLHSPSVTCGSQVYSKS